MERVDRAIKRPLSIAIVAGKRKPDKPSKGLGGMRQIIPPAKGAAAHSGLSLQGQRVGLRENHRDRIWPDVCECGGGAPCVGNIHGFEEGNETDVSKIFTKWRR